MLRVESTLRLLRISFLDTYAEVVGFCDVDMWNEPLSTLESIMLLSFGDLKWRSASFLGDPL